MTKADKEYQRIIDCIAFTVEGYVKANHNQHGTRYHFDDGSFLVVSDTRMYAKTEHKVSLLAWHPTRRIKQASSLVDDE